MSGGLWTPNAWLAHIREKYHMVFSGGRPHWAAQGRYYLVFVTIFSLDTPKGFRDK